VILDDILQHKQAEVARASQQRSLNRLCEQIRVQPPVKGFAAALRRRSETGTAIIAEVKKGSPSKGIIRSDFDPIAIARVYQEAGAACLSVLTDERFFFGHLDYLASIRAAVDLPLLRKDFIVDAYQIYEARAFGADAVLLIAAALDLSRLQEFSRLAGELELDVLLEVHDEAELERALQVPAAMLGINNRNLQTFHTDLATTERLLPLIPAGRLVVAESGLRHRADIRRLQQAGAQAFLIGESLMREADVAAKLTSLLKD
jgi:indole-3-glycerol phosphate synthase